MQNKYCGDNVTREVEQLTFEVFSTVILQKCTGPLFRSGTDLISPLILFFLLFLFLLGQPRQKSLRLRRFKSDRDEILHRLTESDFRFDAALSGLWPLRHFTQQSAASENEAAGP